MRIITPEQLKDAKAQANPNRIDGFTALDILAIALTQTEAALSEANKFMDPMRKDRDQWREAALKEQGRANELGAKLVGLDGFYNQMADIAKKNWAGLNREKERAEKAESQLKSVNACYGEALQNCFKAESERDAEKRRADDNFESYECVREKYSQSVRALAKSQKALAESRAEVGKITKRICQLGHIMHGSDGDAWTCDECKNFAEIRAKLTASQADNAHMREMIGRAGNIFLSLNPKPRLGDWNWPQLAKEFLDFSHPEAKPPETWKPEDKP